MTAITTSLTKEQNDALGAFISAQAAVMENIFPYAIAYKRCVDLGIDMSEKVSKELGFRLLKIANGELIPKKTMQLLALPDATVTAMATLPANQQERIWTDGIKIWRDNKIQVLPIHEVTTKEIRRAVDIAAGKGKGRVVDPEEQQYRSTPRPPPKRDKEIVLILNAEEFTEACSRAHKAGKSLKTFLRGIVRKGLDLE